MLESNGTLLTEFLTAFQNYAMHSWSYLLLNFSTEYQNLSTKSLWFVQLLSNFSSCHLLQLQEAMGPVLRSVWRCKLFSSSIVFSNGSLTGEMARRKGGVVASTTLFCLLYGTPLSGQLSYLNWSNFGEKNKN